MASTLVLSALVACSSPNGDSSAPEAAVAPTDTAAAKQDAAAPASAPQNQGDRSLEQQKRDLMLATALDNARALREQGDLVGARAALQQALAIDPGNADALAQYAEVQELLGERPGDIQTTKQNAENAAKVRVQTLKLEAESNFQTGQEARGRHDYDAAIRAFEQVQQSIKWSSLDVDWGDLPQRNAEALAATRIEKETSERTDREAKLKEAVERIKEDEAAERARSADRVATLLESANYKFEAGDYQGSIELCDQVIALQPSNTTAKDLRHAADEGRRSQRKTEFAKTRADLYRRFKNEIEELRIPFSEGLTAPDPEYWARVSARTPTGAGGELPGSADDQRIREMLKTIRIPVVNFNDDDIKTVCTVLSNFSGITIMATSAVQSELESAGTLITLTNLTNLPLDSILSIVTKRLGDKYAWTVKSGVVQITTLEDAFGQTVIRTHAIQDLTFGRTDFKGPEINKIALPGEYGDDAETSIFNSDLEKVVQITPDDVVTLIKENVARETWELGDKKFSITPAASNQILVIHTPEVQNEIEAFLNDLRRFTTTVVQIESRFVEITDAFLQEVGVDFRGLGGVFGTGVNLDDVTVGPEDNSSRGLDNLGTGVAGSAAPSAGIFFNDNSDGDIRGRTENFFENPLGDLLSTSGGGSFQFGILGDTDFNAVVTAVEKSVNASEVMAPELTVYNTERAYVTVINEVSFLQDFDVDVANTAFIANPEIGILQEGVVLDVRPTISYDRKYVTLDVRTTVATIQRPIENFETTLGGFTDAVTFQLPRLEVQNANTTVIVPDGGAVILGGLKTLNYVNRRAEVPWVAQIPIVGVLFRQTGVDDEAKSLVILVKADIRDLSKYRESTPLR
jgi:Flp pilus assembly secretin CpaC/tetratricopeptide (TPR) repeat protein